MKAELVKESNEHRLLLFPDGMYVLIKRRPFSALAFCGGDAIRFKAELNQWEKSMDDSRLLAELYQYFDKD